MAPPDHAPLKPGERTRLVKARALELGFASCGVTDLRPPPHGDILNHWVETGMHGQMEYMRRQLTRRLEPARILPGAVSAIVVTRNYYSSDPPARQGFGRVARYASGRDYHDALAQPLEELCTFVRSLGGPDTTARAWVDAGAVPERELAQRAGLGWIGKNTMLIDPHRGSFFFIATVLTSFELEIDGPFEMDRCGTCRRCIDACPTQAIVAERVLDARKCISYLTIEHRGAFDHGVGSSFKDYVFGCDICQDVCPWNESFAAPGADPVLEQDQSLALLSLDELVTMTDAEFEARFGGTALERTGVEGLRRNAGG